MHWPLFDQPIAGVMWPASLEQLTLGGDFSQPIDEIMWPVSLQQLVLDAVFNRLINKAA